MIKSKSSKIKILIGILIIELLLIGVWWFLNREISEEKALNLANQIILPTCKINFTKTTKNEWTNLISWLNQTPENFKIIENICPLINEYKEDHIYWMSTWKDNVKIVGLIGVHGKFRCIYAEDVYAQNPPYIRSLEEICGLEKEISENKNNSYGIIPAKEPLSIGKKGEAKIWFKTNKSNNVTLILYNITGNNSLFCKEPYPEQKYTMKYSKEEKYYYVTLSYLYNECEYCFKVLVGEKNITEIGCFKLVE